ncbi:peptidase S9 [Xylariales sp. PMI_506]|nr:peptidase S9 [Xylariales sp. PMI_506]
MASKLEILEKLCSERAGMVPHWLPGGRAFWYFHKLGEGENEFILVDCEKGHRRAAFDQAGLAAALSKETGKTTNPGDLPFWWINIAQDGSWMRFQLDGQTWQYNESNGGLEACSDEFNQANFDRGHDEAASPQSSHPSSISFVNQTSTTLHYSWIDHDGEPVQYGAVGVGQLEEVQSYAGHNWRLSVYNSDDSKQRVVCTVKSSPSIAYIEQLPIGLTLRWEEETPTIESSEPMSDKDKPTVLVRDFNIWIKESNGTMKQISYDGVTDNTFKEDHIYRCSDGRHLIAWQCKPASNRVVNLIESSPEDQLQPKLHTKPYNKPGDNVEVQRPRLFDLLNHQEISVDDALFRNPYIITNIGWSQDSGKYRFIFNERGHKILRLLEIGLNGTVKTLAEESSKTFVDYNSKAYHKILESSNEVLWTSERDGWNHLYLFDLNDGSLKSQVTRGNWVFRLVESVDEKKRVVYFRGLGMVPSQDPYYVHLAKVNFDGSDFQILTQGDGTHMWKWGPKKRYLIDAWSRADYPPQLVVRDGQTGDEIVALEHSDLEPLREAGWQPPEIFAAPGRDGETLIYGLIFRPAEQISSQKYPILERIYAGPQDYYTPKAFYGFVETRKRANEGYVIVMLDGMGTNWRSKSFHDVCYKNLKDGGFPDRIAWIRSAAETRPWMDVTRVGCYGSSAGGQNAAAAVLHHSDFYKAASASAGCHDNRMDKLWWNELWMGYPVDQSYVESSNVTHAAKLGGALMLFVGEMDTNVDPASTMQLANALIKADKDFELVVVPGAGHGLSGISWVKRKEQKFFKTYLQDV